MNLTTVAGARLYSGLDASNATWSLFVDAASAMAIAYMGRNLIQQNYSQIVNGTGTDRLILEEGPVTAVSSVIVANTPVPVSTMPGMYGYTFDYLGLWLRGALWPYCHQIVTVNYTAGYPSRSVVDPPAVIPASRTLAAQNPYWISDTSVKYFVGGLPLTRVFISPAVGEYYVDAYGNYTFNVADVAQSVIITYLTLGIPADVSLAVSEIATLAYKRRSTIDVKSKTIDAQTMEYIVSGLSPSSKQALQLHQRVIPI